MTNKEKEFQTIRGGWRNVPSNLKCKTDLKEMGLNPTGEPKGEVWNGHDWIKLYDVSETKERRKASPAQLEALAKARETARKNNTCQNCKKYCHPQHDEIYQVTDLDGEKKKFCKWCKGELENQKYLIEEQERAEKWLKELYQEKENILFLKVETNGLSYPQPVEINLVDINGNTIYYTLVKPFHPIDKGAEWVHGISNRMAKLAPEFSEVWEELKEIANGKMLISFTSNFCENSLDNALYFMYELEGKKKEDFDDYDDWQYPILKRRTWNDIDLQNIYGMYFQYEDEGREYISQETAAPFPFSDSIKGKTIAHIQILYKLWQKIGLVEDIPSFEDKKKSPNNRERLDLLKAHLQNKWKNKKNRFI